MTIIGVTGHRFLKATNKIISGVDQALAAIEERFDNPFIILSALAEGADRLVAFRVLACWEEAQLIAVLPLPLEDYMTDFSKLTSKAEFINLLEQAVEVFEPEEPLSREEAYAQTGRKILDQCDVLIAVWDGAEAQGTGGTGEVVALARARGLPMAWVHAGNREPGTDKPTTLGKIQGQVTMERFQS